MVVKNFTGEKVTGTFSEAAKDRFLQLLRLLEKYAATGETGPVTSAQIERLTGWSRDTIRKDISCLAAGVAIGGNSGYELEILVPLIKQALGLDRRRKFCVVGLGRLGSACLNFTPPELVEFELAAGFDTNVNRVEILSSPVPLFPAYKMAEVISRLGIEIAMLCVPATAAQAAAEKCISAGIKGILNFAPSALKVPQEVVVRNVYVTDDLRSLAVQIK